MISLPNPKSKMTMTSEQLEQFKSNYCELIVDGMDMDCLVQMCHDLLMDSYKDCTEQELKEEILDLYDEDVLNGIIGGNIWRIKCYSPVKCPSSMNDTLSAKIYRNLFTDNEWDAISSALKDYADYGDEEATIADSIDAKITRIFQLTKWTKWHTKILISKP